MRDMTNIHDVKVRLNDFEKVIEKSLLIIDGTSLTTVLSETNLEHRFFELSQKAPSVCICRCSPTQKAIVAKKI